MPPAVVEEACTITAKGQTTVPKVVRQALGVGYGGRIAFRVEGGAVTVRALAPEAAEGEGAEDPALAPFLPGAKVSPRRPGHRPVSTQSTRMGWVSLVTLTPPPATSGPRRARGR